MTDRRYSNPAAFKQALEQRLRNKTKTGLEFARRRQLLVFDRFLARVITTFGESVILKGGLVLELRLDKARTTKDIDLHMMGSPDEVFSGLQEAGRLDLGDFMTFEIRPDKEHPEIVGDDIQYVGYRYRSECKLAGKLYGQSFGVDVAFGDPIYGDPEIVTADSILAFADISPPTLQLYPLETHIAEKLHAYTMPRSRINTRVKDLPDIALLATARPIDSAKLQAALEQTFSFRKNPPNSIITSGTSTSVGHPIYVHGPRRSFGLVDAGRGNRCSAIVSRSCSLRKAESAMESVQMEMVREILKDLQGKQEQELQSVH